MSKEINRENVTNAMKLLLDNKGCSSDEIRQKLKDYGYNWSYEDYNEWRKTNCVDPGINKGLVSGNMCTALSFVLYARGGQQRWEYIQDWMFEPTSNSSYCLKNWIKASEKIMESSRQLEIEALDMAIKALEQDSELNSSAMEKVDDEPSI